MSKRIAAIAFIWLCTTAAWWFLGGTLTRRTYSADSQLNERVVSTWGASHTQPPPTSSFTVKVETKVKRMEWGRVVEASQAKSATISLPLLASNLEVALDLQHRKKGLLWYSTYKVAFSGAYSFQNPTQEEQTATFVLNLPAEKAIYDGLVLQLDDTPLQPIFEKASVHATGRLVAGRPSVLKVAYRSHGLGQWNYALAAGGAMGQVRDFKLRMTTNFGDIDFPDSTLSPTEKRETPEGWELEWRYSNLVTGVNIGMAMPDKLQPGPLAGEISFFAPVSLFFFFFLMFIITTIRAIELHPMNFFFLATAFFAFHLLLAYLVDHISIHTSFVICSVVSVFLVVAYLRLVVGMRFAAFQAGLAQLVYLVLFSYAFFFKGFTGLAIAIGSVITLFVVMQMTGRMRGAEKFATRPA